MATTIWLQELFQRQDLDLDKFIFPSYFDQSSGQTMATADKARFHDLINSSQQLCEAQLEASPGDRDARYFLGSLHGVLGSFSITIERSRSKAFKHGKKAFQYPPILFEPGRQLDQDAAQLRPSQVGSIKKPAHFFISIQQLFSVGNTLVQLQGKTKPGGDHAGPLRGRLFGRNSVEGVVDLSAVELPGVVVKILLLRQILRIEDPPSTLCRRIPTSRRKSHYSDFF